MNPEKETRAMNAKEGIDTALTIGVARYPIQSFCLGVRCALGVKSNGIFQVQRSRVAPGPMPQTVRRREKMPVAREPNPGFSCPAANLLLRVTRNSSHPALLVLVTR